MELTQIDLLFSVFVTVCRHSSPFAWHLHDTAHIGSFQPNGSVVSALPIISPRSMPSAEITSCKPRWKPN